MYLDTTELPSMNPCDRRSYQPQLRNTVGIVGLLAGSMELNVGVAARWDVSSRRRWMILDAICPLSGTVGLAGLTPAHTARRFIIS
jgi:hypothetical protein